MAGPVLAIIADDLTGALDAAAPFSAIAGGVAVATAPDGLRAAMETGAAVIAVSTRSREIPAKDAAARVAAARAALPPGVTIVKKIDSRLKGNLDAELGAFDGMPLVVLPAIPAFGRIVRGGALSGFGVTEPVAVAARLGAAATRATVPDVTSAAEMDRALAGASPDAVLVGARGLSEALARRMALPPAPQGAPLPHPLVIAAGSRDPITLEQIATLRAAMPIHAVAAPGGELAASAETLPAVTLLHLTEGSRPVAELDAARAFARTAAPYLARAQSMVLTGGATAEAMLDALGISVMRITGEALPGMPVSRAGTCTVVTKSGGFGAADALSRLATPMAMAEDHAHG